MNYSQISVSEKRSLHIIQYTGMKVSTISGNSFFSFFKKKKKLANFAYFLRNNMQLKVENLKNTIQEKSSFFDH